MKCIEEEIPFEVPEGWEWVRLGDLAQYKKGPFGSSITKSMFVPDSPNAIKVYEQKNAINKDATLGTYFITTEKYETLKSFEVFPNDIIVSCAGTIGETFVLPKDMRKGIINQALMKISLYDIRMLDYYLIYFDQELKVSAKEEGHGIALKNIPPFDILKRYLVAMPPYEEQQRIVEQVNNLLNYVNDINDNKERLEEVIFNTKAKILDVAIRGKLVPQEPGDEPSSILLARIRAEKEELIKQGKLKRDKKESIIYKGDDNSYYEQIGSDIQNIDAEIPFTIPENWAWVRLHSITTLLTDGTHKTPQYSDKGYIFLSSKNVTRGVIDWDNVMYIPDKLHKELYNRLAPEMDDILLAKNGTTGKAALVDRDYIFDIYVSLALIRLVKHEVFPKYILYAISAPFIQNYFNKSLKGIGVPNLHLEEIRNTLFPIPPKNEQVRICEAIDGLIQNVSKIESNLN